MAPNLGEAPVPEMSMSPASTGVSGDVLIARSNDRFLTYHLWLPLVVLLVGSALLMGAGLDQALADRVFRAEGGQWLLKNAWFTRSLVHHDGKLLSTIAGVTALVAGLLGGRVQALRSWRRPLLYLAGSVALSTLLVSVLKSLTHMDCPWDLSRYGGARPFIGLFESRHGLVASGCFPAGHASAGYAWLALYFFALAVRPAWRWPMLAIGAAAGLLFGISQQLRGAHFLSHDLWTAAVCWFTALALYRWLFRPAPATSRIAGETP